MSENVFHTDTFCFVRTPKEVADFSFGPDFSLRFASTHYPNALHRFMQQRLLGIYWKKREE